MTYKDVDISHNIYIIRVTNGVNNLIKLGYTSNIKQMLIDYYSIDTFDTKSELEKVIITGTVYDFDTLSNLLGNILNRKMIEFKRTDVDKYLNVERIRKRVDGKVKQLYKITNIK